MDVRHFPRRGQRRARADGSGSGLDYDEVRTRLSRSIARTCPRWLRDQHEDLVQAALVRVLEAERRGDLRAPVPNSYLWKVAYSATVDRIRFLRRRPRDDAGLPDRDVSVDPRPGPLEHAASVDAAADIRHCTDRLVEPRRVAVRLFLLGHEVQESAAMTGWNVKRVRNLLYRGLAQVRECLTERGWAW